jgi:hypothetical protein
MLVIKVEKIQSIATEASVDRHMPPFYLATMPSPNKSGYFYGIAGTEWGALEDLALRFSVELSNITISRLNYR